MQTWDVTILKRFQNSKTLWIQCYSHLSQVSAKGVQTSFWLKSVIKKWICFERFLQFSPTRLTWFLTKSSSILEMSELAGPAAIWNFLELIFLPRANNIFSIFFLFNSGLEMNKTFCLSVWISILLRRNTHTIKCWFCCLVCWGQPQWFLFMNKQPCYSEQNKIFSIIFLKVFFQSISFHELTNNLVYP